MRESVWPSCRPYRLCSCFTLVPFSYSPVQSSESGKTSDRSYRDDLKISIPRIVNRMFRRWVHQRDTARHHSMVPVVESQYPFSPREQKKLRHILMPTIKQNQKRQFCQITKAITIPKKIQSQSRRKPTNSQKLPARVSKSHLPPFSQKPPETATHRNIHISKLADTMHIHVRPTYLCHMRHLHIPCKYKFPYLCVVRHTHDRET